VWCILRDGGNSWVEECMDCGVVGLGPGSQPGRLRGIAGPDRRAGRMLWTVGDGESEFVGDVV